MLGHQHHEHSGEDRASAAREALTAKGEQWTELRADVFDALATHASPASAYDIADDVSAKRGKRMAPNSIYRILDVFVANNLAIRHPGCLHDCIFLVCDECGEATHIDNDAVTGAVRGVAEGANFKPERPV